MCPFFDKDGGHAFYECIGFPAIETIGGECKGCEMFALFKTSKHVLTFFCFLLLLQNNHGIAIAICFGIQVGDNNVKDAFHLVLPQTPD